MITHMYNNNNMYKMYNMYMYMLYMCAIALCAPLLEGVSADRCAYIRDI